MKSKGHLVIDRFVFTSDEPEFLAKIAQSLMSGNRIEKVEMPIDTGYADLMKKEAKISNESLRDLTRLMLDYRRLCNDLYEVINHTYARLTDDDVDANSDQMVKWLDAQMKDPSQRINDLAENHARFRDLNARERSERLPDSLSADREKEQTFIRDMRDELLKAMARYKDELPKATQAKDQDAAWRSFIRLDNRVMELLKMEESFYQEHPSLEKQLR